MEETKAKKTNTSKNDALEEVKYVHSLAHYAHVQAHEAELKARYAMIQAERAMSEAESVRQIAESLANTARVMAKITANVANSMGREEIFDKQMISFAEYQQNHTVDVPHQHKPLAKSAGCAWEYDKRFFEDYHHVQAPAKHTTKEESSSCGMVISKMPIHSPSQPPNSPVKYTETFPTSSSDSKEALPKEIDSSHSLPILWENSYQGPREFKPVPWSEKKSLRKIQRKLRNLDIDSNDIDESEVESNEEYPERNRGQSVASVGNVMAQETTEESNVSCSKEKLLNSFRFSEMMTNDKTTF